MIDQRVPHLAASPPGSLPLVGVTGRRMSAALLRTPPGFHDAPVDAYFSDYAERVAQAGAMPIHLPMRLDSVDRIADRIDGVILTGGDDIDPARYGAVISEQNGYIDPARDEFELHLASAVMQRGKPIAGICRGAQLVNVALGGTLVAHLPAGLGESHSSYAYPRAHRRHVVEFVPGSLGHRLYGSTVSVNSFHHQAVDTPGAGVTVTGTARDGIAEFIEVENRPIVGAQWHPECLEDDPIFSWLTAECARLADPSTSEGVSA